MKPVRVTLLEFHEFLKLRRQTSILRRESGGKVSAHDSTKGVESGKGAEDVSLGVGYPMNVLDDKRHHEVMNDGDSGGRAREREYEVGEWVAEMEGGFEGGLKVGREAVGMVRRWRSERRDRKFVEVDEGGGEGIGAVEELADVGGGADEVDGDVVGGYKAR